MAIAVRTDTTLSTPISQANLVTALITAFTNAGYSTAVDNYTSGTDRILVYQFNADATKTLGTNFVRIRVSNTLQVFTLICTGWNTTTKAATNASNEVTLGTLANNLNINFTALNGSDEFRLVLITQGTTFLPLGILIPTNRPAWWNLDSWSYGFIFSNVAMTTLRTSSISPYNNQDYELLTTARLSGVNAQTNRRDVLTGLVILTPTNFGIAGKTSDDLAIASGNGSTRFDVLSFPGTTQQFLLAVNGVSGLAIRTQ